MHQLPKRGINMDILTNHEARIIGIVFDGCIEVARDAETSIMACGGSHEARYEAEEIKNALIRLKETTLRTLP